MFWIYPELKNQLQRFAFCIVLSLQNLAEGFWALNRLVGFSVYLIFSQCTQLVLHIRIISVHIHTWWSCSYVKHCMVGWLVILILQPRTNCMVKLQGWLMLDHLLWKKQFGGWYDKLLYIQQLHKNNMHSVVCNVAPSLGPSFWPSNPCFISDLSVAMNWVQLVTVAWNWVSVQKICKDVVMTRLWFDEE